MTHAKERRKSLGRGLDSLHGVEVLLPDSALASSSISQVELARMIPNPDQPRRVFDEEALGELSASIRSIGLVQPITLKEQPDGRYMIVSGERRWRAASLAGLTSLPAYIVKVNDEQMMEMALIENIQREDLNAIEIALSYRRLLEESHCTQDELAEKVGKKRSSISNYLRLLRLPAEIQIGITEKKIDMGHARALLALDDTEQQLSLYKAIIEENLSVREVEQRVKNEKQQARTPRKEGAKSATSVEYAPLVKQFSQFFGSPIKLVQSASGKGKLTISFSDEEDLVRICQLLEKRS